MNGTVTAVAGLRTRSGRADDSALARRAAAGDRDAFAELYRRHESRVFNVCHRIVGSRDDAAGATREAFAGVVHRLSRIGGPRPGLCHLRARLRERRLPRPDPAPRACPADYESRRRGRRRDRLRPRRHRDDPERKALLEAHNEEIRTANLSLPLRQREVLALRELEELSYDEIAELMDTTATRSPS